MSVQKFAQEYGRNLLMKESFWPMLISLFESCPYFAFIYICVYITVYSFDTIWYNSLYYISYNEAKRNKRKWVKRETIAERIRDNMHELAKTGRWLGGTTPTGYSSESVQKVTTDGKAKKACKLKLIPEEAEIIKLIFDLYIEYDSLTAPESELMKLGIKTKNNKHFTRFSIKSILQNPVYMTADETAYNYLVKENTDLNSDKKDFDDIYAIMAYNRTRQEKGKAVTYLPPDKWIVAVCLHPGIIPGKIWISVQDSLNRNKSKNARFATAKMPMEIPWMWLLSSKSNCLRMTKALLSISWSKAGNSIPGTG